MYRLPDTPNPLQFPDDFETSPEGLLALGGNLHPLTLLSAYSKGIFPWFNPGDPILWWHPDPRMVLFPQKLKISKSMKKVRDDFEKNQNCKFYINRDFAKVIQNCANATRKNQKGTWISDDMQIAYQKLNQMGHAHSFEIWENEKLVGGLYGIALNKVFFGESMFSLKSNMSKLALIYLCKTLIEKGFLMIDCQQSTPHLKSLGAQDISRGEFLDWLKK